MSRRSSSTSPSRPPLPAGCTHACRFTHPHLRKGSFGKHWRCQYHGAPALATRFGGSFGEPKQSCLQLVHANIVPLLAAVTLGDVPWEVVALAPGGDLGHRFVVDGGDPAAGPTDALRAASDVAAGLAYLHGRRLVHLDVKPENCLLMGDGRACLCDFEFLVTADSVLRRLWGTIAFIAPEYRRGLNAHQRGLAPPPTAAPAWDVWSFGILLWELAHREEAYADVDTTVSQAWLHHQLQRPPPVTANFARSALALCLVPAPEKRATASEVAQHLQQAQTA